MLKFFSRNPTAVDGEEFPLHKAAFENDIKLAERLLRSSTSEPGAIDKRDTHGFTALHIATMLGHREIIFFLLKNGASVSGSSKDGWNAQAEAISYGNREIITAIVRANKHKSRQSMRERKEYLTKALAKLDDFYMEIRWDFESWIPLISKILPSDRCRIYKCGGRLRLDSTLVDFSGFAWQRGDISLLFAPERQQLGVGGSEFSAVLLDRRKKVYQRVGSTLLNETTLQREINDLMSEDLILMESSLKSVTFSRVLSGWFFKQEKSESVGRFSAEAYTVDGFRIVTRKRREHLSVDDVRRNKHMIQNLLPIPSSSGGCDDEEAGSSSNLRSAIKTSSSVAGENDDEQLKTLRDSLPPPPRSTLTWEEYKRSPTPPKLGRPRVEKKSVRDFKPVVAMVRTDWTIFTNFCVHTYSCTDPEDFPLLVERFVEVLEVALPLKHIEKLREFCQAKLPPGFPVKLEIPLIATVSAKVTFEDFEWRNSFPPNFFAIPPGFKESVKRFTI